MIIGKGSFLKNKSKPNNMTWIDENLSHDDILNCENHARCTLMLLDAIHKKYGVVNWLYMEYHLLRQIYLYVEKYLEIEIL